MVAARACDDGWYEVCYNVQEVTMSDRLSLRTIVLATTGQDVRRCGSCALCEDIVCDDQDVTLEMLVQWVIVNDVRALTCRTLWSDQFMRMADGACTNDLNVPVIFMALRAEARRRGIQPTGEQHGE